MRLCRFPATASRRRGDARHRQLASCIVMIASLINGYAVATASADDQEITRYFRELRQRGLFVVAEHYAASRLAEQQLSPERRVDFVVELSQTLVDHAWFANPQQREELWNRAGEVLRDELAAGTGGLELLKTQLALISAARARMLKWELTAIPEDRTLRREFTTLAAGAVSQLTAQIGELERVTKNSERGSAGITHYQARQLQAALLCELGDVQRFRAELEPDAKPQQASDLVDADTVYQRSLALTADVGLITRCWLGRAECSRLRHDYGQARAHCETALKSGAPVSPMLRDAVDACRMRCWLDEDQPLKAAEALLAIRQSRHVLSGELWFVQLQTLLVLRDQAAKRKDDGLVASLNAEAELALTRVAEQVGGSWQRFCRLAWDRDQSQRTYGPELDRLMRTARSEYLGGNLLTAARMYAEAITAARNEPLNHLRRELAYTRGSILLEAREFEAAALQFQQLASEQPAQEKTAAASLLGAYSLGRLYQEQRTQSRRTAYTQALEQHLNRFGGDVTAGDARFMLAQLEEQRLQTTKALPLYLAIPSDHARYLPATAAVARCSEILLERLQALGKNPIPFQTQTVEELTRRIQKWSASTEPWTADQAETLVRLARIYLGSRPVNHAAAVQVLQQLASVATAASADPATAAGWKPWLDAAFPLRLVALAGTGHSQEARRILTQHSVDDPQATLAVVLGLDQLAQGPRTTQFVDLTELLVAAVAQLEPHRDRLTAVEQQQFDLARTRAYLLTGRTDEGMAVVNQLARQFAKDAPRLRTLASLVSSINSVAARTAGRDLWQTLEGLESPGSAGWLSARAGVIESMMELGELAEARKLLAVTKLLYPELAGQRARYEELETRLRG